MTLPEPKESQMAWFLALQGPPNKVGQSLMYELHESADRQEIAQEMMTAATIDRVVAIPAVFQKGRNVTLYVRPAAWGAWAFYEMSEEERREMMAANPLINAIAQAAKQQQAKQQSGDLRAGVKLPRLDST
jgi:hypothetical protein